MAIVVDLRMQITERPARLISDQALGALQIRFRYRKQTRIQDLNGGLTVISDRVITPFSLPFLFPILFDPMVLTFSLCKEHFRDALSNLSLECRRLPRICEFLAANIASYAIDVVRTLGYAALSIMADVEFLLAEDFYEQGSILIPDPVLPTYQPATVDLMESLRAQLDRLRTGSGNTQNGGSASSAAIYEKLQTGRFKATEGDNLESCSICLEDYLVGAELIKLPCSHVFHESCIVTWLEKKNSCPLCRSKIDA